MKRDFTSYLLAAFLSLGLPAGGRAAPEAVRINVLSNRPDLISGSDALVRVVLPSETDPSTVTLEVDGRNVTSEFAMRSSGHLEGVLTELSDGENVLKAVLPGGSGAKITITNHPIGGPVFAGLQVQPWVCSTQANGLGPALDAQCNAPTVFRYSYKNAITTQFTAYDPDDPPPAALIASTTTDEGKTLPYIVRVERGTLDRSIYDIAVLFDPAEPWSRWAPQEAWNHKLMIPFGGGCAPHHTQDPPGSVFDDTALSRGFIVATSGLNTLQSDCNTVTSAEAAMMLKEHVVESYGDLRYTTGQGGSGGSVQQHQIASTYPGLLDGIIPSNSFEDIWSTAVEVAHCKLLLNYFTTISPALWASTLQQAAVAGTGPSDTTCAAWVGTFAGVLDPTVAANCNLPADQVYNPQTNPTGVRCDVADYQEAVWGFRDQDGFARRPLDNVGVQYGLRALQSGEILPEQFVDLNEKIGGLTIDAQVQPERMQADPEAIAFAYRSGQISDARRLATVPIVDHRRGGNVEIHTDFHSYAMRARLLQANGTTANQIIWTGALTGIADPVAFDLMDRWLSAVEADHSDASLPLKVIRNKPASAADACLVGLREVTDGGVCRSFNLASTRNPATIHGIFKVG